MKFVDDFINVFFRTKQDDVAKKINRRVFLRGVVIKEIGIDEFSGQIEDATHLEYRKRKFETDCKGIYLSKEAEREKNAQLLQNFIDSFKTA